MYHTVSSALDVERLHDDAKLFCAVREITRKSVAKLTIHATPDALCGSTNTSAASLVTQLWKREIEKINSGQVRGHDDLPTELLKSTVGLLADTIADIFNDALERQEPLELKRCFNIYTEAGRTDRSTGECTFDSLTIGTWRKTLSLVVLLRIASQSGLPDESTDTADCVRKRSVNAYRSSFSAMT